MRTLAARAHDDEVCGYGSARHTDERRAWVPVDRMPVDLSRFDPSLPGEVPHGFFEFGDDSRLSGMLEQTDCMHHDDLTSDLLRQIDGPADRRFHIR